MRHFLFFTSLLCSLFLCSLTLSSQTVSSYLISSAGDAIMSGEGALYLSVGEPMNTELQDGDIMVSQGFLQVTVQGNILNSDELLTEHIKVFPNPTMDELHLSLDGNLEEYSYRLYDVLGNSLTERIALRTPRIEMHNYPEGTYLLTIHKGLTSSKSLKIIKQ